MRNRRRSTDGDDTTPVSGVVAGGRDTVIILALVALLLFASPFAAWWSTAGLPWFFPFLLWGLLIALVAAAQFFGDSFED